MKRRALMFLCSMAISTAARGQTCSVQTVTPSIVMMPCYGCSDFAWFIVPEGVTWEVLSAASMVTVPRGIDSGVPYLLVRDGASNSQNPGGDAIARSLMANTLEPGSTYSLTWTAGVALTIFTVANISTAVVLSSAALMILFIPFVMMMGVRLR